MLFEVLSLRPEICGATPKETDSLNLNIITAFSSIGKNITQIIAEKSISWMAVHPIFFFPTFLREPSRYSLMQSSL